MAETDKAIEELKLVMHQGKVDATTVEKIMDKLIVIDKNLIIKTDIEDARNFTILLTLCDNLKILGLKKSYKTLKSFTDWYIKVRVSKTRMSRTELLEAISAIKREQSTTSLTSRLLGMNDKNATKTDN